jgi:diguanylate cyclase (GGDEF)-like protein/PAS domain S-box-containing protein
MPNSLNNARKLLDSSPSAICISSKSTGNVLFANQGFYELSGVSLDQAIGIDPRQFYANQKDYEDILECLKKDGAVIEKLIKLSIKKEIKWVNGTFREVEFEGQLAHVAWLYDLTQQLLDRSQSDLLATCVTHSNDAVIITSAEPIEMPGPRIVYVNEAFERLTGYSRDEVIGNTPRMLQGPKSAPVTLRKIHDALSQWKPVCVEIINYAKDGSEFLVELDITPIADASGWNTHWISIQRDITERKAATEQIRKLSLAVEQSMAGVILTDVHGNIEYVNAEFVRNSGYSREEVIGLNPRLLQSGKTTPETFRSMWGALSQGQSWRGELNNRRKDGSEYTVLILISPLYGDDGNITHYVATKVDVTDKKVVEAQIQHLAFYDQLTNLPNRSLLANHLERALLLSNRNKRFGGLLFIDLDDFKIVNDTLGHDGGDELLKQVATHLLSCVRESDIVSRFGGDEFVIMLNELSEDASKSSAIAEVIVKKILKRFEDKILIKNVLFQSSCSIGITLLSGDRGHGMEDCIAQADQAMYAAKNAGGNTYRFFDQAI